jgi:catechol 2,3-dioxygenase-like lactoylglutathione lyase family enzyme
MQVQALDHVNIVTHDMEATTGFYAVVLGLERRDAPPPIEPHQVQWMFDAAGRPLVHIAHADFQRQRGREVHTGEPTGAIHHVAFACSGFAGLIEQLEALGLEHRVSAIESIGLRQVFVADPNGVLLELNFAGE